MAVPQSVTIVGSGVFGLSTAYAMSRDPRFANTKIVLLDRWNFEPSLSSSSTSSTSIRNPEAANADTSRIIRRDYPHGPYAALACEAREHWCAEFGANNRYVPQRLLFSAEGCSFEKPKKSGETINYIKDAYEVSCGITPGGKDGLTVLNSLSEIRSELGGKSPRNPASPSTSAVEQQDQDSYNLRGYISDDCGWANAGASMEWLRQQVIGLGQVEMRTGQVDSLLFAGSGEQKRVQGVKLVDGSIIIADLTIIAAGSQSPRLLNMPDICDVYSEVVAYIQLTEAEVIEMKRRNWPLIVNAHRGVFTTGPDHDNRLKFGHFSHSGMIDVLRSANIELSARTDGSQDDVCQEWQNPSFGWGGDVTVTQNGDVLDYESEKMLKTLADYRVFLLELLGPSSLEGWSTRDLNPNTKTDSMLNSIAIRPFVKVRKCWYTDTPSLDFIVDYHPSYGKSLFVATGGNDHAFKFLPIIGEKVVDLAMYHRGAAPEPSSRKPNPSVEELAQLWKFPVELVQPKNISGDWPLPKEQQAARL